MDWNAAIEKNLEALKRIVAASSPWPLSPATGPPCRAISTGPYCGSSGPPSPRRGRLVIVAARGLQVTLPPSVRPRKRKPTSIVPRNGVRTGIILPRAVSTAPNQRRDAPA